MKQNNLRTFILFLSLVYSAIAFGASNNADSVYIGSLVVDDFTGEVIGNASVRVFDQNSHLVSESNSWGSPSMNNNRLANFIVRIPRSMKAAVIKVSKEGYDEYSENITVSIGKREIMVSIPTIKMKRSLKKEKEVLLDGVTVTASKVKMVMHGDTIVYNADAFQMSNGSMLDELIRRLPGVQLKGNQIMVNGRFVSSLLVNGSDFFKGNPAIALQNLPAYTVNKLKVYEREDGPNLMSEKRPKGTAPLVMDVSLKRHYMQGILANADLGYGTHDRWMARLFALRYTKTSRIGVFSNMNNTNDTRSPGTNGEWKVEQQQDGLTTQRTFGIDYLLNNSSKSLEFSGNTVYAHNSTMQEQISSNERFLAGGNTFGRSRNNLNNTTTYVQSQNYLKKIWSKTMLYLWPSFVYYRASDRTLAQSAMLTAAPDESRRGAALDSLFAPVASQRLYDIMTNRLADNALLNLHYYDAQLKGNVTFQIPKSPDLVTLETENRLFRMFKTAHSIYDLEYKDVERDFRNKYNKRRTNKFSTRWKAEYMYRGDVEYKYPFSVSMEYTHNYIGDNSDLFRLDKYAAYGAASDVHTGYLPSTRDSLQRAIDADNSYHSRIYKDHYKLSGRTPLIQLHVFGLNTFLKPGINYRREHIDYTRGSFSKSLTRKLWSWEPELYIDKEDCTLSYKVRKVLPELTDILDFAVTDNPLNIWRGNPNLKNTDIHSVNFYRSIRKYDENWYCTHLIHIDAYWQVMRNAIGQYVEYNRQTGAVRSTPMNINGNWSAGASFEFMGTVDKKKRLMLNTKTEVGYNNSVDYVAVDGQSTDSPRSSVRSAKADETLTLDYNLGKYAFGAKLRCAYLHAESPRSDFQTINTADVDYGLNATVELPLKLKLSTDITLYSRYGYSDPSMNTNNLVWNARLERTFGKFTVMADGFDLLGKLSNVRKVINAQGRTETWYNTVPRYAMLHVMYKMHFKPNRK